MRILCDSILTGSRKGECPGTVWIVISSQCSCLQLVYFHSSNYAGDFLVIFSQLVQIIISPGSY